jgi:hypothetical protein
MLLSEPMVTVLTTFVYLSLLLPLLLEGIVPSLPLQSISWRRQLMLLSEPIVTVPTTIVYLSLLLPLLLVALYQAYLYSPYPGEGS